MDRDTPPSRRTQVDALPLFSVMWALAAVWHLLGNPLTASEPSQLLLVVGAGAVLWQPGRVGPLVVLAVGGVVTMWSEAPVLGNHWALAALVDVALLLAVAVGVVRRRWYDATDLADRFLPVARLCLLGFYFFASFAKLNSAFFDRSVSCATFYFRESTDSMGLSALQLDGAPGLEWAVIVATAVIELAIPWLLVFRRTRHLGVVVGLAFHAVLALDRTHQFFDFSSVLAALFVLFLPSAFGVWVAERVGSVRARLLLRHERAPGWVHLVLVTLPVLAGMAVVFDLLTPREALRLGWWPWQVYAVLLLGATLRFLGQRPPAPDRRALRVGHVVFLLVPLMVVANGLTPYLELKTGFGWNMYANLRTVDGETNHYLIPRTLPVTGAQADLVQILDSDDAGLRYYREHDYELTWQQLRAYLSDHPDARIRYRRGHTVAALTAASDDPELVEPLPLWQEKLQLFRAVDGQAVERCQPSFGPAR
ncbi:MAG: HTTM domain-containing protein [Acidimicrobiales bacterium]